MNRSSSLGFFLTVGLVAGGGMIAASVMMEKLNPVSQVILFGVGIAVVFVMCILVIVTRLYRKTTADEAFVKTGMGGRKCIIDGGAIVIPVIHEIIPVSLRTFKLQIDRTGPDALITADFLRADVKAVFYVRVQKDERAIEQAATSLGAISGDAHSVQNLIQEKLVSALRTVADILTGENLTNIEYDVVRGIGGVKEASVVLPLNGTPTEIKVCVAHGTAKAAKDLDAVRKGEKEYHFIEVMACPGGCVHGGGQSYVCAKDRFDMDPRVLRANALYSEDERQVIRKSHENPEVQHLYEDFLKEPNGHLSHKLLHTHYHKRDVYCQE